jgi:ribosomal protein S18 acetylase RimI-like enzyme
VDHVRIHAKKLYEKYGFKIVEVREHDTYMVLNIGGN